MRAAVLHAPGDLRVEDRPAAAAPRPGQVRLRVVRAGLCGTDASEFDHGPVLTPLTTAHPVTGVQGPIALGHEFIGEVLDLGDGVEGLAVGDRVAAGAGVWCGDCRWCADGRFNLCRRYFTYGLNLDGGLTEAITVEARMLVPVPAGIDDDNAALAQPLAVGLHAVNRSGVRPGDVAVVLGAGAIGSFILAGVAEIGCRVVIAADVDPERLTTATALGADRPVNLREESLADVVAEVTGGDGADVVFEASGVKGNPQLAQQLLRRGGRLQLVGLHPGGTELNLLDLSVREIDISTSLAHVCPVDLPAALEILRKRDLSALLVERVVPLDRIVEDAFGPLAARTARGKFLVDPTPATA
ncbi:zinc-dependent alcohol dehydrogenase [Nakamurella deserti]|uniref:zinc-dependent alcohol dehydrogenase n=1 Tax=Nakamurella deserti TaxID=2164074 RepID=UPI000DBE8A8B|nr:alcohol dehydrogenase catalytic domain-containing protein [Nakamurella deserti]